MGGASEIDTSKALSNAWQQLVREHKLKAAAIQIHGDLGNDFSWAAASEYMEINQPFFIGELTELHLAALVLKLQARGKLDLDSPIYNLLPENLSISLNPWPKKDLFEKITIKQLFNHTSGLPDLFTTVGKKNSFYELISKDDDHVLKTDTYLNQSGKLKPIQSPVNPKNAVHSFTNTFLQVLVLEKSSGKRIGALVEEFQNRPLGFSQTYLYSDPHDRTPSTLFFEEKEIKSYQLLTSFGFPGSMVSSAQDTMSLLRAFFHGHLFPPELIPLSREWVPESPMLERGLGIEKYSQKKFLNLITDGAPMIGKVSGTGAFAIYDTEKKLFFTGSTNQVLRRDLPKIIVRMLAKLIP
ncbi:beta-lactamase [Lunatimonas lonarensis]|uniref:Beta-lactamase n=1 Tax=Lunatimonas lonarensis TaxID=1232681 RepID=R7ZR09_9BACT|nr:serine hydrolase domain-containing protein [Lunatimonas lonarensis]EON76550.1 beta-lactamase [Lunatimonas lonarensis]